MKTLALVAAGGALGAVMRHAVGAWTLQVFGPRAWPVATMIVNITGGLAIGALVAWLAASAPRLPGLEAREIRVLAAVGVLGGFTTFSAFSLELAGMVERRAFGLALGYAATSVCVSVLAVFGGMMLVRWLTP